MNFKMENIPLNFKESIFQLVRNIYLNKNKGYIQLNYDEELISYLNNYLLEEKI